MLFWRRHRFEEEVLSLLLQIRAQTTSRVLGGRIVQRGMFVMGTPTLVPIQPGQTPKFQVTPTFSGAPFALQASNASIESSDPDNFPVALDPNDPTGTIFEAPIPASAAPTGGSEAITITWTYTNTDGTKAVVTGTVTEEGITDDVTGGTFAQIA